MNKAYNHIVFFDGVCNLCNQTVDFLIKHNDTEDLTFCSLQSAEAKTLLSKHQISTDNLSTIYFYKDGQVYQKSEAAFQISKHLNAPFRWLAAFSFLPKSFTDAIYTLVAKNRYRWFGKQDTCRIPTEAELGRFVCS